MANGEITRDELRANYDKMRAEPFSNADAARLAPLLAPYLPQAPTWRECNAPHVPDGPHMIDHCAYEFRSGEYFASCWDYGYEGDMLCSELLLILCHQPDDSGGLIDSRHGGWVVARTIAASMPGQVGRLSYFAPSSIHAHRLVPVDPGEVLRTEHERWEAAMRERSDFLAVQDVETMRAAGVEPPQSALDAAERARGKTPVSPEAKAVVQAIAATARFTGPAAAPLLKAPQAALDDLPDAPRDKRAN